MALRVLDRRSRVGRGVLERVRGVAVFGEPVAGITTHGDPDGGPPGRGSRTSPDGGDTGTTTRLDRSWRVTDDGGQWREGQPVGETKAAERVGGNGVGAEEVHGGAGALSGLGGEVEGDGEMTEMPL